MVLTIIIGILAKTIRSIPGGATFILFLALGTHGVWSQQIGDSGFLPELNNPTHAFATGPKIFIDQAHNNFHTVDGRYQPFANLLRKDGYVLSGLESEFSAASLEPVDLLVIANALHESNLVEWQLPTPSAFTAAEIESLKNWVFEGGSLMLIADHMPFPGAAAQLAEVFGVLFSNGFVFPANRSELLKFYSTGYDLSDNLIFQGRDSTEKVDSIPSDLRGEHCRLPEYCDFTLPISQCCSL